MLRELDPTQDATGLTSALNFVGLGLVTWGIAAGLPTGTGGARVAAVVLLVVAGAGWLLWQLCRIRPLPRLLVCAHLAMALAGGALATFEITSLVFIGVASLSATLRWRTQRAAVIVALGPTALLVSALATGHGLYPVVGGVSASLGGAVLGISRRQALESSARSAQMEVTAARADAEQARAELLAGRNHLARELHDVLADTLSALSLQLKALGSMMGPDEPTEVRNQLEASKRLVRESLGEARGAVRAFREDAISLEAQLVRLADERHASLQVEGLARAVTADVGLALYRVAQEALTNVVKHAPGATAHVRLGYEASTLTLSVENGPGDQPSDVRDVPAWGDGYGLQGIRERVLLIGGHVEAGPLETGWLVHAEVPA